MTTTGMLTIGQLAEYVGVTVRAIRHYHQRGLLAEPGRDASGYRRYDAQAVVELMKIKILAEAGVPLARVGELLAAGPEQLAESIADIDAALRHQIAELEQRRRRIADLAGGERMFLPAELAGFLDELRAAGVSERTVRIERDGWIVLLARYPQKALDWLAEKRADLADPEYRRLYCAYDQVADWDPADPRVDELADALASYIQQHHRDETTLNWDRLDDPTTVALLSGHYDDTASPALRRLSELTERKLARARQQA